MSKRASGEGSIIQRSDGRWSSYVTVGWRNGKQLRKYFYGKTQREVKGKLEAARRLQQQGVALPPEKLTVEAFLRRWLESQKPPAVRPSTYTAYENHVRLHLIPHLGNKLLSKIQPQDVRDFLAAESKAGLAPKTVRHLRTTLRTALNIAVTDGLAVRNVAALAKPPKVEKRSIRVLSPAEARRFLYSIKGDRLCALYTVALALGLRQGEILGLALEDTDLERGEIAIRHALQKVNGKLELVQPKTKHSSRTLRLPQVASAAIADHLRLRAEEKTLAGSIWRESNLLFTTRIGTPIDPRNLLRSFGSALKRAALPHMRFHDLRHSAATLLLVQGVHPRYVMELLGHSSISLTMNTYSHILKEMGQETAQQMDAVLSPEGVSTGVRLPREKVN